MNGEHSEGPNKPVLPELTWPPEGYLEFRKGLEERQDMQGKHILVRRVGDQWVLAAIEDTRKAIDEIFATGGMENWDAVMTSIGVIHETESRAVFDERGFWIDYSLSQLRDEDYSQVGGESFSQLVDESGDGIDEVP